MDINKLKDIANNKASQDNEEFLSGDYASGNFSYAYDAGMKDGQILLAREILKSQEESF